ncbi:class I SAM-dependent methyltransferase [Mucilaginibacter xinganensis]|uniref:Trans-aconitate 2-methyltransferase n=1 Tax=Mucilaginibacter xinganensis TaxID=1234841 RepID=A0A223NSS2_9SPHI|nr:methyltransferase domain-containing protein [Mucilaginibacter xinganensis]ASU32724.1 Trans-aconitate 2-methyltransferase [Mucilaginibacter xinganensis]
MKWNAELYDDKHAFVFQYGESVLELLDVKPGEQILDLGCGTGPLTKQIKELGAEVTGIDASAEMIEKAAKEFPDVDFKVADGANFHFNRKFDAVFSNAALHWMHAADDVIKCVYDSLETGGRFVAEMGGKGNMAHMIAATQQVLEKYGYHQLAQRKLWYFPSLSEYSSKLEARGFRVTYAIHFDRPTLLQDGRLGVTKWLNMFGDTYFEGIKGDEQQQILSEITDLLEPHYNKDGQWFSDYTRLRFIAVKE